LAINNPSLLGWRPNCSRTAQSRYRQYATLAASSYVRRHRTTVNIARLVSSGTLRPMVWLRLSRCLVSMFRCSVAMALLDPASPSAISGHATLSRTYAGEHVRESTQCVENHGDEHQIYHSRRSQLRCDFMREARMSNWEAKAPLWQFPISRRQHVGGADCLTCPERLVVHVHQNLKTFARHAGHAWRTARLTSLRIQTCTTFSRCSSPPSQVSGGGTNHAFCDSAVTRSDRALIPRARRVTSVGCSPAGYAVSAQQPVSDLRRGAASQRRLDVPPRLKQQPFVGSPVIPEVRRVEETETRPSGCHHRHEASDIVRWRISAAAALQHQRADVSALKWALPPLDTEPERGSLLRLHNAEQPRQRVMTAGTRAVSSEMVPRAQPSAASSAFAMRSRDTRWPPRR
jgi:hypothetical protein